MRKAAWILAIVLIGITGVLGLVNGPRELGDAETPLQQSVSIGVTLYGLLGIVGAVGLARRRPWCVGVISAWAVVALYVATVASFAFHDPTFSKDGTLAGVLGSGISTAVIGALLIWAARIATRVPKPAESGHIQRP